MDVKKVGQYLADAVQNSMTAPQKPNGEDKPGKDSGVSADKLDLSKDYQELAQVKKIMMSRDQIRTEKVDQIRSQLESGTYAVDPEKIAARMVEEII